MDNTSIKYILEKDNLTHFDIVRLLLTDENERKLLFAKAAEIKFKYVGNKVYLRGLVEYTNKCIKNCYYCGIRKDNKNLHRYVVSDNEVIEAAKYAYDNGFGSIVIQSGENKSKTFTQKIAHLLDEINKISKGKLGITLSLGEQTEDTYKIWKEKGARRYLLRIETSNNDLYKKLHPNNKLHDFNNRLNCLLILKKLGYQVGTGVMIGLPFQNIEHLAADLEFFKAIDVDMVGMGPYIEHENTPLYQCKTQLLSKRDRFILSLKMIAILRIMMKDINIAATTAMQTLDKQGREKAIKVGANIIMPNLTPLKYRTDYLLYEGKPCIDEEGSECIKCIEARIKIAGAEIAYNEWGDSKHYYNRN
ncbi:MAG TPA: [FeFe] hydrogenase H-cluster radical SAM maturase HydE [Bacteroidales bacterium]|nr:[FeFe] hydrogenase H-cluster radical SAM maturase HydE [Bacteroidales bacterium]